MSSTHQPIERLSLTFRAEAPPAPRSLLPGGWWMWCLIGVGIGLGGWLVSRHFLVKQLGEQLAQARTRGEAILAMESLMLLDPTASGEFVAGLKNPDAVIARTAFRTLESQITRWQELTPNESKSRIQVLSQSLSDLPDSLPPENGILASSLATRLLALCIDRQDDGLEPSIELCQRVIQRTGQIQRAPELVKVMQSQRSPALQTTTAEFTEQMPVNEPPPPLPPPDLNNQSEFKFADTSDDDPTGTEFINAMDDTVEYPSPAEIVSPTAIRMNVASEQPLKSSGGATASLRLVASPVRSLSDDSESESIQEHMVDVNENTQDNEPSLTGIDAIPIEDVVRMLGSVQPKVAQAAALSLRRRGMPDSQITLAIDLATGTELQRLEVLQQLHRRTDLPDPRVWLLWMAQDGQPSVRQRSVALLHSMLDIDVMRQLRLLLQREQDSKVAHTIRQVLTTPQ